MWGLEIMNRHASYMLIRGKEVTRNGVISSLSSTWAICVLESASKPSKIIIDLIIVHTKPSDSWLLHLMPLAPSLLLMFRPLSVFGTSNWGEAASIPKTLELSLVKSWEQSHGGRIHCSGFGEHNHAKTNIFQKHRIKQAKMYSG